MQFFEQSTNFSVIKKLVKAGQLNIKNFPRGDPIGYYKQLLKSSRLNLSSNEVTIGIGERHWYETGMPYFKIFPAMVDMMADVSIDIPCTAVKAPYKVFSIRLSPGFHDTAAEYIKEDVIRNGPDIESILIMFLRGEPNLENKSFSFDSRTCWHGEPNVMFINYTTTDRLGGYPCSYHTFFSLLSGETVEHNLNEAFNVKDIRQGLVAGEYVPSIEHTRKIISLCVATCFFGVGQHDLVLPDIAAEKVVRRRQQNLTLNTTGKPHFTLGREIRLPATAAAVNVKQSEGTGRELSNSHIRRGHMRWQAHGKDHSERKLVFIHPMLVRPDLPIKRAQGCRI